MAEITRTRKQGIGLPVEGVEPWDSQHLNLTEASPAPAVPQPSQATRTALSAYGEPYGAATIKVQEPGVAAIVSPASGGIYQGATYLSKLNPDTDAEGWYGWDPAHIMSGIEVVDFSDADPGDSTDFVDVTTANSGAVVAVVENTYLGEYRTDIFKLDPSSNTWGNRVNIETYDTSTSRCPVIVCLPSGRLQVYEVVNGYLRLWYSDDEGDSWSFGGDKVASQQLASAPYRACAAYSGGQVLYFAEFGTGQSIQFGSNDMGLTLQYVTSTSTGQLTSISVSDKATGFIVAGNTATGAGTVALESAFFSAYERGFTDLPYSPSTGSTSVVYDPAGIVWVWGTSSGVTFSHVSYDQGSSFVQPSEYLGSFRMDSSSDFVNMYGAAWSQGRAITCTIPTATAASPDRDLRAIYWGGWSNKTLGQSEQSTADTKAAGFDRTWASFEDPQQNGWTLAASGGSDYLDNAGGFVVSTSGTARNFSQGTALASGVDVGARCRCQPNSITATFEVTTSQRGWLVEFGLGTITAKDAVSGITRGTANYVPADTSSIEIWCEIDESNGVGIVWYRLNEFASSSNGKTGHRRREWVELARRALSSSALTPGVVWGNSAASGVSTWYSVQYGDNSLGRFVITTGNTTAHAQETTLRGRALAGTTFALQGQYITPAGGPSWRGETWELDTSALYRVENTLNPNPRIGWRATQDAASEWIAYRWAQADQAPESAVLAVVLRGCNAHEVSIQTHEGGVWVDRGDFTPGPRQLPAANTRDVLYPSGGVATKYLQSNEYAGAKVYGYTDASTAKSAYNVGRIKHHTEGKWSNLAVLSPRVLADRLVGTSGMIDIVPDDFVILLETENDLNGVRVKMDSNTPLAPTPEGFWQVGSVDLYWVYPFGDEYAWGRSVETQARVEATRTRDGQVKHRVTAPPMRTLTLNWDPFDQSTVEADDADPDYITFDQTNDGQAASRGGTALVLEGMVRRLNGPAGTVLYIPKMPTVEDSALLDRRREFMVGRIQEAIGAAYVLGDELESEVVNPGAMVIEEEV